MARPTPLSGFPELLPAARVVEREVIASLSRTFELHGFANIETRAVEPLDRLAKGGEIDKEIYVLRRLQADETPTTTRASACTSTSPCRSPATSWRTPGTSSSRSGGSRSSRPGAASARRRVATASSPRPTSTSSGRDELPFHHDVEVMRVMVQALGALPLPRAVVPGQQPQAHPGLLPRPRHPRRHGRDPAIDKLDKLAGRRRGRTARRRRRAPRRSRRSAASTWPRSGSPTARSSSGCKALGVNDDLLDRGLAELSAVLEGCADVVDDRVDGRGQPAHRPRPRLLHRHGRRDLHGGLRAAEVGRRRRTLRRARRRRAYDVPGRRHLLRRLAHPAAPDRRGRARGQPRGAQRGPGCPRRRGEPSRQRADRRRAPPPRHRRARWRPAPRSTAARSAPPSDGASRSSGSPLRAGRRLRPGQGHPLRRPGRRRPGHVVTPRRRPPSLDLSAPLDPSATPDTQETSS